MASFGKAYVPPNINQIPPNQRQTHPGLGDRTTAPNARESNWDLVASVSDPFGNGVSPREFGFWFNYFWKEAVTCPNLTDAQKVKVAEAFFSVFRQNSPPSTSAFTIRGDFASRDNAYKENVLRQLLIVGFQRVALDETEYTSRPLVSTSGKPLAPRQLVSVGAAELNVTPVQSNGEDWLIAFRCDARSYEQLCRDFGFNSRTRSANAELRLNYALDEQWHPFANPVYTRSLFLRRGTTNRDNCLHSVISVTTNFSAATHFPLLDRTSFEARSTDGQYLCHMPFDEWTDADELLSANHRMKLRAHKNAGVIDYLERDNYVHIFHMNGLKGGPSLKGVNTQAVVGDVFPERGLEKVPASHLLGEIIFQQRYWYNPYQLGLEIFDVVFAVADPIRWVSGEETATKLLGETAKKDIENKVREQIGLAVNGQKIKQGRDSRNHFLANPEFVLSLHQRIVVSGILNGAYSENRLRRNALLKEKKDYVKAALLGQKNTKSTQLAGKIDALPIFKWSELLGHLGLR
jgi:hypothetical protein